jgi:hypothetical protein
MTPKPGLTLEEVMALPCSHSETYEWAPDSRQYDMGMDAQRVCVSCGEVEAEHDA